MSEKDANNYTCERCKRVFDEDEYKITKMQDSCILHLEKNDKNDKNFKIYNNAFDEYVKLELEFEKRISFYNIIFLECLNEKDYNHLEEIKFTACKFYKNLHFANSEKVFYEGCHFHVYWNNIKGNKLTNQEYDSYIFKGCTFHEKLENTYFENKKTIYDSKLFNNCKFKGSIRLLNGVFNEKIFKDCEFKDNINLEIKNSDIKERLEINEEELLILNLLDLQKSTFSEKVKIKCSEIKNINFYNSTFKDLADFYKTTFFTTNFNKTDFNDISVFTEATFKENVEFKYTTFNKLSIFRNTVFKKEVDLTDSIFNVKGNFLGISSNKDKYQDIKVSNRETARIIKDSFEQQNNIIEANKFYALEMKEMENELEFTKRPFEWLVFKIHGLTSNHSQDWTLALYWILIIGATFSFINNCAGFWSFFITVIFSMIIFFCNNFNKWIKLLLFYGLYILKTGDILLHDVVKVINPFEKSSGIGLIEFLSKIIIAYLVYQLIISIRQNTRRK